MLRSYIWHCIGIPIVASIFMIVHFWRVRKDGGISGPAAVMLESEVKEAKEVTMDWRQLWEIISAPDNVPIVALMPLLAFYIFLAWRQAKANDQLMVRNSKATPPWLRRIIGKPGLFSLDGKKKCTSGRSCYAWNFWPPSSSPSF